MQGTVVEQGCIANRPRGRVEIEARRQKGSELVNKEVGKGVRKGTAPPKNTKSPYFNDFCRAYGTRKLRVKYA